MENETFIVKWYKMKIETFFVKWNRTENETFLVKWKINFLKLNGTKIL